MTSTLCWRPVPKEPPPENVLPGALKLTIARHLWDHDGSLRGDPVTVDQAFVPYLQGVADAGGKEVADAAGELIQAIREYGEVELWIG